MDCEKFESVMMDELYGELDELTSAAAKRHVAGCARCAARIGGFRATRRVATVPLVDPPAGLEERILRAAGQVSAVVPLRRRVAKAVSVGGSWAMRPQTAMAAVFLVMIGTSVLLLRGKAARAPAGTTITVTEEGAPAPEVAALPAAPAVPTSMPAPSSAIPSLLRSPSPVTAGASAAWPQEAERAPAPEAALARSQPAREESVRRAAKAQAAPADALKPEADVPFARSPYGAAGAASPPPPPAPVTLPQPQSVAGFGAAASNVAVSPFDAAVRAYQAGQYAAAQHAFDALAADPNAALWAARAVRESKGCRASLARFDRVAQRAAGTPVGWDALLEGALCYRAIGDLGNARARLAALLGVDSHKDRARAELDRMGPAQGGGGSPNASRAAPAAPAPAAPPPAADGSGN